MDRRRVIVAIASVFATAPVTAFGQPTPTPVIGLLSSFGSSDRGSIMPAFLLGLREMGYVDGENVTIEYRWAEGSYDRLPTLASDLVRDRVAVIATITGTPAALAARAATTTIPIVFVVGSDPVAQGLVSNLGRPKGNVTGVTFFTAQLGPKRLDLLREVVTKNTRVAVLSNPTNPATVAEARQVLSAAKAIGVDVMVFEASTENAIDRAFAAIAEARVGALSVSADPFFLDRRNKLVASAADQSLPAIYADREFAEAGGLLSYGASRGEAYRTAGTYVGRILKGESPSNLPIAQPGTFEMVINLRSAKAQGITIPQSLLLRANQLIQQ